MLHLTGGEEAGGATGESEWPGGVGEPGGGALQVPSVFLPLTDRAEGWLCCIVVGLLLVFFLGGFVSYLNNVIFL